MSDEKRVDLFDMSEDAGLSFLDKKKRSSDGLYRPRLDDAKDKGRGYMATLRFLANVVDGKLAPAALEKPVHYAKLPDYPDLKGYYDCGKNFGGTCPICDQFWKMKNSRNQAEVERSELIGRVTNYYSYVLILEDENQPDLEGQILVYQYGFNIKEKIKDERNGVSGTKCNVFDPANGKDFRLVIKNVGGFPNYNSSTFREASPMQIWNDKQGKFVRVPVELNEAAGRNTIAPKAQKAVLDFLMSKKVDFSAYGPAEWDDETRGKIERIVSVMSGRDTGSAEQSVRAVGKTGGKPAPIVEDDAPSGDVEDFFDDFDK